MLATKSPVWQIAKPSDFDTYLGEQLARLGTDHIDVYLFHALGAERWESDRPQARPPRAGGGRGQGRPHRAHRILLPRQGPTRSSGSSTATTAGTICQIQYNYMDTENQAGTAGPEVRRCQGPRRCRHGAAPRRAPGRSAAGGGGRVPCGGARQDSRPSGRCSGSGIKRRSRPSSAA